MRHIIAVDFDGCLCESKWPDIGEARADVIRALITRQAEGAALILWTCREGPHLDEAVIWCMNHGLRFDAVNDNLKENQEMYGNNSRKVYAHEYWDDKAVLIAGKGVGVKDAEDTGTVIVSSRDVAGMQGYRYHPPKRRIRDKVREIWRILRG